MAVSFLKLFNCISKIKTKSFGMAYPILHNLNLFTFPALSLLTSYILFHTLSHIQIPFSPLKGPHFVFLLCHLAAIPHTWNTFSLKFIWIISSFLSFHYSQGVSLYMLRCNLSPLLCSTSVLNNTCLLAVITLFFNVFYALLPGYKPRKG